MPTQKRTLSLFRQDPENPFSFDPDQVTFILPSGNITIKVRTMIPDEDSAIIYHWISQEYAGGLEDHHEAPAGLEEVYHSMLASDFCRPFMGLINEVPVCQLEIYKLEMDSISFSYPARPGDHGLKLLLAPLVNQEHILLLLRIAMNYFFSFKEITRIVTEVESRNDWLLGLFNEAGYQYDDRVRVPYKLTDIFVCTRESFIRRQ